MLTALQAGVSFCGQTCPGPLSGGVYPKYQGYLSTVPPLSYCVLCGDVDVDSVIKIKGQLRFGLCSKCAGAFHRQIEVKRSGEVDWSEASEFATARVEVVKIQNVEISNQGPKRESGPGEDCEDHRGSVEANPPGDSSDDPG